MQEKRGDLIRHLDQTREELLSLARSLSQAELSMSTENPGWDVKDTLAHLSGSEVGLLGTARRIASGQGSPPPGFSLDNYNQHQVEKRRERSVDELLAELAASRIEAMRTVAGFGDEQLVVEGKMSSGLPTDVISVLRRIGDHEILHCEQIRNAIDRK